MLERVTDSVFYVGVNDHEIDLFEGQYPVPNGMAYNSYVIKDEAIAVMDTVDTCKTQEWLARLDEVFEGRVPDYLVVQHMEPDHSASIRAFVERYPGTTLVGNAKTLQMLGQFFQDWTVENTLTVKDGESLSLGSHRLQFVFAPMVHWPEVMLTYDSSEKILFSADAFGKFGALDVEDTWADEARRYYIGIVGKYGMQVQNLLKKAAGLEIKRICPLHGPVLVDNLGEYLGLYDIWSSYRPESKGVCICYTSVYGGTKKAVKLLEKRLQELGVETVCHDLARTDMSLAVADAFRYDRLVLATTTYNADIFPFMKTFLEELLGRNYQNRTVAFIENGTWAPTAARVMRTLLEGAKGISFIESQVVVKSTPNEQNREQLAAMAADLERSWAE